MQNGKVDFEQFPIAQEKIMPAIGFMADNGHDLFTSLRYFQQEGISDRNSSKVAGKLSYGKKLMFSYASFN